MSWRQFSMELAGLESGRVEQALMSLGAQAVTYTDAADTPVLEPVRGETPLWPSTRVSALFPGELDAAEIAEALRHALALDALPPWHIETLEDRAWEREWLKDFRAMRFGQNLWVCPTGYQVEEPGAVVIHLDPGLAFGTGTHATTALCLDWLDGSWMEGRRVLDYGCGSGILAVAALLLGAEEAVATDIDPQALDASRANAARNGVSDRLTTLQPAELDDGRYDVVLANILATPLIGLAPDLAMRTRSGGEIVLSGILTGQESEIRTAYEPWFDLGPAATRDDWILISGRRRVD
ncbi:MAG: 50S ribosomal protein L11 methyltransferase [Gammaproteobacteria bacterium]